jgi:hypothetical protein
MKAADYYASLEKNKKFKSRYIQHTKWWKNMLFIAPSCILFLGLFGLIYLLNFGMLSSWYTIPFAVVFILGTLWLKAIKRHVQKEILNKEDLFRVCLAKRIGIKEGYVYLIYASGMKRHNEYFTGMVASESVILEELTNAQQTESKRKPVLITEKEDEHFYLRAFSRNELNKRWSSWEKDSFLPLLEIKKEQVYPVNKRDIEY